MLQTISSQSRSPQQHLPVFPGRKELFHSKNGARKSAKKILIVITDGQKYKDPLEYSDVIPQAERAGIVRYAIGVRPLPLHRPGSACTCPRPPLPPPQLLLSCLSAQVGGAFQERAARQELDIIGSAPSQDHVFKVDNFAALGSIQKQLQEKIFAVEGKWGKSWGLRTEGSGPSCPLRV